MEYAEFEAVVKDFPPFREAMKKRGIDDMDLVMVDAWYPFFIDHLGRVVAILHCTFSLFKLCPT